MTAQIFPHANYRAGRLTPESVALVARDFLRRGEAPGGAPLPDYAGSPRTHGWDAPVYNAASHHVSRILGGIASALYAGQDFNLTFTIADSKTERDGDELSKAYEYAPCMQFARMLGAVEGFIPAHDTGNIWDDRWTSDLSGATRSRMGLIGVGTTTFEAPTSEGAFWIHSGAPADVTVNGTTVSLAGDAGFERVDVTGTSHTVVTTDASQHILGFDPAYGEPRLRVSRAARAGSYAEHWVPGANGPTGLWDAVMQVVQPDAVVTQIGTNSPETSVAPIGQIFDALAALDVPTLICAPGGLNRNADRNAVYAALWDAADAHDFPLLDLQAVLGEGSRATELGLMDDSVHENRIGGAWVAAALAALIGVPSA